MAVNPEVTAALALLNTATNTLGDGVTSVATALDGLSTRVFALVEKLNTHMTEAEVAAVKQSLDQETNRIDQAVVGLGAIATSLNGLAADPVNPVPEPVPPPPPINPVPEGRRNNR